MLPQQLLQTLPEHLLSSLRYSQHKHNAPVEEVVFTPDRVPYDQTMTPTPIPPESVPPSSITRCLHLVALPFP